MVDFLLLEHLLNLNFPPVCPGGSVVKNPAVNAEDVGLIPGPGRPPGAWSHEAPVPQLLACVQGPRSRNSCVHAPQRLKAVRPEPMCCNGEATTVGSHSS